ncbi:hypothetical protein L0128_14170 [candidate division KSB1 bacterium]|nr:hypothetical protein [candidate division KSB1 bacterium]
MSQVEKHYKTVKSALRKHLLIDTFCIGKYSFSPYHACGHACKYCDGRAEKYYVAGDFEKDIVIRKNLPDCLAAELQKVREPGMVVIGSGVSDPYQPVESTEEIMRQCAQVLAESHFPVLVMTKSALVLRDLDYWQEVHARHGFILAVSLTFPDDGLRQIFEPAASSVEQRLAALATFKQHGMTVGVLAMPFIPYLSDDLNMIGRLFARLKQIQVDFVIPAGLTLRPGKQKTLFLETVQQHFPGLETKIAALYRDNRPSGKCDVNYAQKFYPAVEKLLAQYALPCPIPHTIYHGKLTFYDEIFVLLYHLQELYARKGVNTFRLRESTRRFVAWLSAEKKFFNRHRKLPYQVIEERLKGLIMSGQIATLLNNPKLAHFLYQLLTEQAIFDYQTLKLTVDRPALQNP